LRHVRFLGDTAGLLALMDRHRAIVAPKFATVLERFGRDLAGTGVASWIEPRGGYFVSLDVLDGCAQRVVALARAAGIALTPAGATHPRGHDPHDRTVRIAPTYPDRGEVAAAAEGVAVCVLLAATTALLEARTAQAR
jgi:DNA-binding transcriptional MocR family regulator